MGTLEKQLSLWFRPLLAPSTISWTQESGILRFLMQEGPAPDAWSLGIWRTDFKELPSGLAVVVYFLS